MRVLSRPSAVVAALVAVGSVVAGSAGVLVPASAAAPASSGSSPQSSVSSLKQRHFGADPAWFVDQVSRAHRAAEIKVPRRPARFTSPHDRSKESRP